MVYMSTQDVLLELTTPESCFWRLNSYDGGLDDKCCDGAIQDVKSEAKVMCNKWESF
jgi:hypothetical protein